VLVSLTSLLCTPVNYDSNDFKVVLETRTMVVVVVVVMVVVVM